MSTGPTGTTAGHFSDRLADAIDRCGAPACVGLDPVLERLPARVLAGHAGPVGAIEAFCTGVIAACRGVVPAIKPQSACFERYGAEGVAVLWRTVAAAREAGLLVVLDAKRGDIGVTAGHYAAAAFGEGWAGHGGTGGPWARAGVSLTGAGDREGLPSGAHAVTVNGYLGPDTLEPFMSPAGRYPPRPALAHGALPEGSGRGPAPLPLSGTGCTRGVFVLVRTSNPGSDAIQSRPLADGRTVAELMADTVARLGEGRRGVRGLSDIGAVVGATKPADAAALRARMPDQIFLIPGYGAQGGTLADVRGTVRRGKQGGEAGVLVTASRSVIYAGEREAAGWAEAVAEAAVEFVRELRPLMG